MFKSTTPVLYFSPSIINQIQISNDDGLVITKSSINKSGLTSSVKVLFNKLFIPLVTAETSAEYEKSKELQISTQYDNLSRAVKTVKEAQEELLAQNSILDENSIDTILFIEGVFNLQTQKSKLDDCFLISVTCPFGDYTVHGLTSVDNWTSKSLINQLLMHGEVTASAIVFPLSIKEKKIEVKIACIFIV